LREQSDFAASGQGIFPLVAFDQVNLFKTGTEVRYVDDQVVFYLFLNLAKRNSSSVLDLNHQEHQEITYLPARMNMGIPHLNMLHQTGKPCAW
jgi:hypothetical protein